MMGNSQKTDESREAASAPLLRVGWLSKQSKVFQTALLAQGRVRAYRAGETIYHEGDPSDGLYGLARGALEISVPSDSGLQVACHRADPGFWIGDLAIFSEQPRLVSIKATCDAELVFVPQSHLWALVDEDPAMLRAFYLLTHQNMALALRLLSNLTVAQSERRLGLRLLHYHELSVEKDHWIELSQEHLADLLALSLPTLQRALRRLADDGLVELAYRRLRVLDPEALLARCRD